jgi:hypothetical protein
MFGKAILAAGLLLDLFLIIGLVVSAFGAQALPFLHLGVFGIPVTVAGGAILLGVWVAEGFVVPRQPPRG